MKIQKRHAHSVVLEKLKLFGKINGQAARGSGPAPNWRTRVAPRIVLSAKKK